MKKTTLSFKKRYLSLILLLISFFGYSQSPTTFTTSGTWICPQGVTSIQVEAWGAGGAGGGATGNPSAGGGGAGGAYVKNISLTVIPGTSYSVTVGTGGAGSATSNGGNGNPSTFALTVTPTTYIIKSVGGNGGLISSSNSTSAAGGAAVSTGNIGGTASDFYGLAGLQGTGTGGSKGGNGGASAGGAAGGAGSTSTTPNAGGIYGGGGSGGKTTSTTNKSGGDGANGQVVITFTCPSETAAAGADQSVCTTTANLAGNTPSTIGLTGAWTQVSGTAVTITTPSSPTSGITGLSGSATLRWTINNGRCGTSTDDVIITKISAPVPSITPSPADAASGVCYGGASPVTSISWAATATATSYDVYFGAGSLPGTLTSNVATNSYTTGSLLANTTYHWKVVAKNGCGDAVGSNEWTFTTATSPCIAYCTPSTTSGVDGTGITRVSYSTVSHSPVDTGVYNDYSTSQIGNVFQGDPMTISVTTSTKDPSDNNKDKTYYIKIWVDWNNDGDFTDAGEEMFTGDVKSTKIDGLITVPAAAIVGNHRMRIGIIRKKDNKLDDLIPCFNNNGIKAEFKDYTINVISSSSCTLAPAVSTSPSNSTILNGANTSFTATFANIPTSYIWEVSSDGGTNFTPITNGGVYSGATTATLTITAAIGTMNGFNYRVYANNACGTSNYSALALLTVNVPINTYCAASSTANTYWIANFSSLGNLKDTSKTSIYTVGGYADYSSTTIATQVPGGGMNFSITTGTSISDPNNRQYIACYVDWNGDGDFKDLGEDIYNPGLMGLLETTFGVVVPVSQSLGNYRLRIRTKIKDGIAFATDNNSMCTNYSTGETEDYTIAVVQDCASKIQGVTNVTQCGSSAVTLNVTGLGGTTEYRWYTTETGGTPTIITSTGTWTTPIISSTTTYYVTSYNGSCESLVRTPIVITVIPTTIINFSPAAPVACGEDSVLTINAAGGTTVVTLFTEDFENATNGFTVSNNGINSGGVDSPWSVKTNTYQSSSLYWKPAVSSGQIDTNFAFTSSDYNGSNIISRLTTTDPIDTRNYVSLTLTFRHYFSFYSGVSNSAKVQVLAADGTTWTDVDVAGEGTYISDKGSASKFIDVTIDLTAYKERTNLKFRFQYSGTFADGWAIDDIRLFGTKLLNTAFSWTSPPGTTVNAYSNLACSVPYDPATKATTIYLKPDLSQLESTTFPIIITATLENSCPVSQLITVANKTKVWRGDVIGTGDTTLEWNNPNNWRPVGVPDATNCVIGPENTLISGTNFVAHAKNVVVKSTGTFELQAGNNLIVEDWIHVETGGVFNVRNNASILQTNNDVNTGNVNIERITQPMNYYDYTYWNSPVTAGSNFTFASLSPGTSNDIWSYSATIGGGSGNWVNLTPSTVIIPTKGYIVKAPDTFSSNPSTKATFTATFVGTPNNGPIYAPVSKGSNADLGMGSVEDEDDEWNLIGNPYPSGLDAKAFLDLPANVPVVDGTIYIWTHNTQPSAAAPDPFYGDYVLNYTSEDYASFNKTGGTATASATTGGTAPTGFIASGQAFFVRAATTRLNGTTANATFNNSMRVTNNANPTTGTNSDFFKSRKNSKVAIAEEKHRIWLNLTNNSGAFSQALIGYITDATQGLDRGFDGESLGGNDVTFYSIIPEANLTIQGRSLPFDSNDTVPLGFNAAKKGNYSIRIDHLDGLFDNQNIYLEDKDLNVIYDLKQKPYVFDTEVGTFDNRFVLRYSNNNNKTLSLDENSINNNLKISYIKNNSILMINNNSIDTPIQKVTLFNILGQSISTWKIENQDQQNIQQPIKNLSSGIYIAKVKTSNGDFSKKIIVN